MTYILLSILLIAVIGIVTDKLNAKTPCSHDWHEHDTKVKCSKCSKTIPNYNYSQPASYSEAA
ncbi:MAG: hypothetical protein ACXVB0_19095 [Mucilaginibacter sp.]